MQAVEELREALTHLAYSRVNLANTPETRRIAWARLQSQFAENCIRRTLKLLQQEKEE